MLISLQNDLKKLARQDKANFLPRFFKTGIGEYGEGDLFIGVTVPEQRQIALKYKGLPLEQIEELLKSPIHEERLTALFILVHRFTKAAPEEQKQIYDLYLKNTKSVNNWDLVDSSAHFIVGAYLFERPRQLLYQLASSDNLWERRIAMISTYYFIKRGQFTDTLKIAEILLVDKHDLIHKAVGWMLREIGNRDLKTEEAFLNKHYQQMPRTMLRYAIEKFSSEKRQHYLSKS